MLLNIMSTGSHSIPNLITPGELQEMLRISKTGVYRLVDRRALPFYKVRGALRFDRQDVLDFLQNNRVEPAGLK